jgi:hypothetical protein
VRTLPSPGKKTSFDVEVDGKEHLLLTIAETMDGMARMELPALDPVSLEWSFAIPCEEEKMVGLRIEEGGKTNPL